MRLQDTADGAFTLFYTITTAGQYAIEALLDGQPFRNSPLNIRVLPEVVSPRSSTALFNGFTQKDIGVFLATAGLPGMITVRSSCLLLCTAVWSTTCFCMYLSSSFWQNDHKI